jgi:hypothetical protein
MERAHSHRIPQVELKCLSLKRRGEMVDGWRGDNLYLDWASQTQGMKAVR